MTSPSAAPPSPRRARGGYTLIELAVATGASAVLVAAMSSALTLAGLTLPGAGEPVTRLGQAHAALNIIARDAACARAWTVGPDRDDLILIVDDRDGDDADDTVRYRLGGADDATLIRRAEDGGETALVTGAAAFEVTEPIGAERRATLRIGLTLAGRPSTHAVITVEPLALVATETEDDGVLGDLITGPLKGAGSIVGGVTSGLFSD